jgi:hypothetical protein
MATVARSADPASAAGGWIVVLGRRFASLAELGRLHGEDAPANQVS